MYYTYSAYASFAYRRDGRLFTDELTSSDEFRAEWQLNEWLTRQLGTSLEWIREDHLELVAILVGYRTLQHSERRSNPNDCSLVRWTGELRMPGHDPIILDERMLDTMRSCWRALIG